MDRIVIDYINAKYVLSCINGSCVVEGPLVEGMKWFEKGEAMHPTPRRHWHWFVRNISLARKTKSIRFNALFIDNLCTFSMKIHKWWLTTQHATSLKIIQNLPSGYISTFKIINWGDYCLVSVY